MNEVNKEALHAMFITLGYLVGFVLVALLFIYGLHLIDTPDKIECRDGKLFEVTHEGNITIYDPTYKDCEEKQ